MSLAKSILVNVLGTSSTKTPWEKLEGLYQTKGILNRLLLNEQFNSLCIDEHTKIFDHLSVINGIVSVIGQPKEAMTLAYRKQ